MALQQTYRKMNNRFNMDGALPKNENERVDLLRKHIMIGIPYNTRQKKDIRSFIEIIHGIETDQFKPMKVELDKTTKVAKCPITVSPEGEVVSSPILSSALTIPTELTNETYQQATDSPHGPSMQMQIRPVEEEIANEWGVELEDCDDEDEDPEHGAEAVAGDLAEYTRRREALEREVSL
jgi:hypothetical protein